MQFSIRLPPRTKLGLELLAIDSQFSLSQAVEWAVADVLRTHKLSNGQTVSDILSAIPEDATGAHLALLLYPFSPQLIGLNDRRITQIVWTSKQMAEAEATADPGQRQWKQYEVVDWAVKNWKVLNDTFRDQRWSNFKPMDMKAAVDNFLNPQQPADDGVSIPAKKVAGLF